MVLLILAIVGIIAVIAFNHGAFGLRLRLLTWLVDRPRKLHYIGRPYDPAYPASLRIPPTDHDVRTCRNCRVENPTWRRVCLSCHHVLNP